MTKKSRTILFFLLFISFAAISPGIIMYSQGYRFDFSKMEFLKTGGAYVKVYPAGAGVWIDGRYKSATAAFSRDLLIQNLLPKDHKIEIRKDGYQQWEKTLPVEEMKVSEAKYVILFPNDLPFGSIGEDVLGFYPYPNENKMILGTTDNRLLSYDADKNASTELAKNISATDVYFSPNNTNIIVKTKSNLYYLLHLDQKTTTPTQLKSLSTKTQNVFFDPNSDSIIYYQLNSQIYKLDTSKTQASQLFKKEKVITFTLSGSSIYSLENRDVYRTNILLNSSDKLTQALFAIDPNKNYKLVIMEGEVFLMEDNKTIYRLNGGSFEKLLESGEEIKYTPYYDRILFSTGNELWVFLVKDVESPFYKKAGSKIFISRFSGKIGDIKWLNSDYFVYTLDGKLWISEVDNRDNINSFEVKSISASDIFFSGNAKKLFLLNGNSLMASENKLIP